MHFLQLALNIELALAQQIVELVQLSQFSLIYIIHIIVHEENFSWNKKGILTLEI